MPLRLIEMVLPDQQKKTVQELLHERPVVDFWYDRISEEQTLVKILVKTEDTEPLIDLFDKHFSVEAGFRLILVPVAASVPRVAEPEETPPKNGKEKPPKEEKSPARISREELYTQISDTSKLTLSYVVLVILSAIVAAIGLLNNNVAVVIGAMVIAPLLGPNMALALAITLGDRDLARTSLKTNIVGIITGLIFSLILGLLLTVDVTNPQIVSRTQIELIDLALALASGVAGVLAFTTGAPTSIIGVMVAVALMPPLVTLGLMLGSQNFFLALGALWLLLTNIICVNLAGVLTFWVQGVRPTTWWEAHLARRATFKAIITYAVLLVILISIIYLSRRIYSGIY
jgi:uncharacterized hydrophobic protein (TIGR00341 family)